MNKLYIDTCIFSLGIGISTDLQNSVHEINAGKKTAEEMFPLLIETLNENNITLCMIDEVYVTRGPGSYTGERLGLTLAKVLCVTNPNVTLYTISSLKSLGSLDYPCVSLIDARNDAFFVGYYDENGNEVKPLVRDYRPNILKYVQENNANIVVSSNDFKAIENLKDEVIITRSNIENMMKLSREQYDKEEDVLNAKPIYLQGH